MPAVDVGKILLFRAGGTLHGAVLREVLKIVEETNLTPIPRTPDDVKGVILHEGNAVPVFRSAGREAQTDSDNLVLMLEHKQGPVGVAVDKIMGVVEQDEVATDEDGAIKYGEEPIDVISTETLVSSRVPDK